MALQKQSVPLNFGPGIDTKTDPKQAVKFLQLENCVFDTTGLMKKRLGFDLITNLPSGTEANTLSTFKDSLLAIGNNISAYSQDTRQWLNKGQAQPIEINTNAVVRTSYGQTSTDSVTASNGLTCVVYEDASGAYYQVNDSVPDHTILSSAALPAGASQVRVNILGTRFFITFIREISAVFHLQYIAVPIMNPTVPSAASDISTQVLAANSAYDVSIGNDVAYLGWNASGAIRIAYVNSALTVSSSIAIATEQATFMAVVIDSSGSTPNIFYNYWNGTAVKAFARSQLNGTQILAPTVIETISVAHLTGTATLGTLTSIYEVVNAYSYDATIASNYIKKNTITTAAVVGTAGIVKRSLALASKPFLFDGTTYFLAVYGKVTGTSVTTLQPTYFLINLEGTIIAKLAYNNAGGYLPSQVLPNISMVNSSYYFAYLYASQIVPVNKSQGLGGIVTGLYAANGVNIGSWTFNPLQYTSEIGANLNISGGFLWAYDGATPTEQNFHLYPENIKATASNGAGTLTAQQYYYSFTYEWTDAQGNIHKSAPSIPVGNLLVGPNDTITLDVPTIRLTTKAQVRIVGYRWSTAQQTYYQFTSLSSPTLNSTSADSVSIVDLLPDSAILGNPILYTTGGVIENIAPNGIIALTAYKNRLAWINAEDRNSIGFSKIVVEKSPVEPTDLFTVFVAPTIGAQGSTGVLHCLAGMDDKLIMFKRGSLFYLTGNGPDDTGANNDFSEPTFISGTVGCTNQSSIVLTPLGLMFQSDKGIWMLGRDLSTTYIGAEVEAYNGIAVIGACVIPGTNQVRFSMDDGSTLMYDYFVQQWETNKGNAAISTCLYQDLQVYLNQYNEIYQQSLSSYLDGSKPVLQSFKTAWIKLTGLQGFQRVYSFFMLGTYKSPHKLNISISYDYENSPTQSILLTPDNYASPWGGEALWGSGETWGGTTNLEQWQIFFNRQKCQAVQITVQEVFDPSYGTAAGAGLTLSGLNVVVGAKKGYPTLRANRSIG